jgi:hypothetical protein
MSKKNIVIVVVVVLVALIVGVLGYKMSHNNQYSVVYLTTGEVYIGHLSVFPSLTLTDSYILQVTKSPTDPAQSNFQLQPINQAVWAPSELHLIEKNVIFYGPLMPTSTIAQKLAGQGK